MAERPGWREHAANLARDVAFAVDYTVCARCGLGWPYSMEKYQRCGLATAGLEALNLENPGLSWHTSAATSRTPALLRRRAGQLPATRHLPPGVQAKNRRPRLNTLACTPWPHSGHARGACAADPDIYKILAEWPWIQDRPPRSRRCRVRVTAT